MHIEAFSEGKDPARPDANEDRLVVLPGRAYAVIDGVTARLPARYDGKLSGQFAADLIQHTLEREITGSGCGGSALVARLTQAIASAYSRFGLLEAVRDDANARFSATLALVLERDRQMDIVLVGDSGVRINRCRVFQVEKDLDGITASLRTSAWRRVAARTDDPELRERASRRVVLEGAGHVEQGALLSAEDLRAVAAEAAADCARRYPKVPAELIARLIQGGILHEQKRHQNNGSSALGYSCLDGFPIPPHLISSFRLDLGEVQEVELFTDGYFGWAEGFGVAAWEQHFRDVEAEDPAKVGRYASVKGSIGPLRADDRTYLGIRKG